jgi:hypothetical protein
MKRNLFKMLFLLLAVTALVFTSCRKNKNVSSDITSEEDNAVAEQSFDDAFNVVDDVAKMHPGVYKTDAETGLLTDCAVITVDSTANPMKITIDFGTGCVGKDGRTRTGKIIVTLTGKYRATGTVITYTFDNFTVNGNKVEGTKTVTNMGPNAQGHPVFHIVVSKAKITGNGRQISWESTRDREWTEGYNTPTPMDDAYLITGGANGTDSKGNTFTVTITKALQIKVGCRWIESGTVEVVKNDNLKRTIDFGNGDCDSTATITVNGKVYTFTMK